MPGFDGTGPLGRGPMTGRGLGFCVLTSSKENAGQVEGFAGLQGVPIGQEVDNLENTGKEVCNMRFRDGARPAGLGPMTGRAAGFCAGYAVPGYMNPVVGRGGFYGSGVPAFGPYSAGLYGYGTRYSVPYSGWVNPWLHRAFGFKRSFGRGRGRGRFGWWW